MHAHERLTAGGGVAICARWETAAASPPSPPMPAGRGPRDRVEGAGDLAAATACY
jgi:hypothetical protein